MIKATSSFKDNLQLLPSVEDLVRIELVDPAGHVVDSIENQPGKQGSLVVYRYLHDSFGTLNRDAARHGLEVFAEHTADAKNRPGAHPNIDRLLAIIDGSDALSIRLIEA